MLSGEEKMMAELKPSEIREIRDVLAEILSTEISREKGLGERRKKRAIVNFDGDLLRANEKLMEDRRPYLTSGEEPALPREPLSERVEDEEVGLRSNEFAEGELHFTRAKRSLARVGTLYDSIVDLIDEGEGEVYPEDLYDLFLDFFGGSPQHRESVEEFGWRRRRKKRRRKRSIASGSGEREGLLKGDVEIAFPAADRATLGSDDNDEGKVKHSPSLSIVPAGADTSDLLIAEKSLTREDIRDITKKSDLSQIFDWMEKLSKGREKEVTAALLVAKDGIRPPAEKEKPQVLSKLPVVAENKTAAGEEHPSLPKPGDDDEDEEEEETVERMKRAKPEMTGGQPIPMRITESEPPKSGAESSDGGGDKANTAGQSKGQDEKPIDGDGPNPSQQHRTHETKRHEEVKKSKKHHHHHKHHEKKRKKKKKRKRKAHEKDSGAM